MADIASVDRPFYYHTSESNLQKVGRPGSRGPQGRARGAGVCRAQLAVLARESRAARRAAACRRAAGCARLRASPRLPTRLAPTSQAFQWLASKGLKPTPIALPTM